MSIVNPELQLAEEFVQHTSCNIFLTGKAGTGKTTFLHSIKKQTHKRMIITAPTGVAAINAGGVTLHSFFQLPFGPYTPGSEPFSRQNQHRVTKEKKNIINSLDLLVIDEISMVRADLLDLVDTVLRRYRRSELPFGGVQLLMIGDLHQLSPVVKDSDWQILKSYYDSPYFFSSTALRQTELLPIELKHIYRQSDSTFIELLNCVRDNKLDQQTLQQLNSRHIPDFSPADEEGYITLSTHNNSTDSINIGKLKEIQGVSRNFNAELDGDFPEHTYPTAAALQLKVGAQVMFVRNDSSPEKRYFNGKIGKITRMSDKTIEVSCPDEYETISVERATWENIEYTVDPETTEISEKTIGTFAQFPLKLAWAITIHKSQGLTFDKAIIDAQAAFAHGQVYVALSRCRTFEGMVLSSPLSSSTIKSDQTVNRFVKDAERNVPTHDKLALSKVRYQQQLLMECFSFDKLRAQVSRMASNLIRNEGVIQIFGAGNIADIQRQTHDEICTVGENFRRQLHGLFTDTVLPADDPAIQERLGKASNYFTEKFETILMPTLSRINVETDNKEIGKKVNNSIKWLQEEAAVKLAAVQSVSNGFSPAIYLRALSAAEIEAAKPKAKPVAATYTEADVGHPELFELLKEWRRKKASEKSVQLFQIMHQKTMVQIAVHLPGTHLALKEIKGIGKKMVENYGDELVTLVADYRKKHNIEKVELPDMPLLQIAAQVKKTEKEKIPKAETKNASLELFRKGKTVTQIATERELTVNTIENHLAYFVGSGELSIHALLTDEAITTIGKTLTEMPDAPLKEVKSALDNTYGYGDIKFVLEHRKRGR
jgi:hypothetical protein